MATEQILGLLAAIALSEVVLPYGQMVRIHETPASDGDLWVFDFARAVLRFELTEFVAKLVAYGVAITLFLDGQVGGVLIVMAVAVVNVFYLAKRKLDRFYANNPS